ncbi:MAG: hypothetical protein KDB07_11345 [Planctomycetes bacterium]|nr:hypothetical protein [Planctomycetota bacterium]
MAIAKKELDPVAAKALDTLSKAVGKQSESDSRSAIARLCHVILLRFTNATTARKAYTVLQESFCDLNDLRISEKRDVITALAKAEVNEPWIVAESLREVLQDIYQQYNVTNFDFGPLEAEIFARPEPVEGEELDIPTIRDEGLPEHPTITGFLDGERLLKETSLLDKGLIGKKNDDRVFMSVYDNPTRITAKLVWAVGQELGILEDNLLPFEALPRLRSLMGSEQIAFVSLALTFYERNTRSIEKHFKNQREPEELEVDTTPFSVQIGFTNEDDHQGGFEPLMPRSEGIGRVSKRAKPKLASVTLSGETKKVKESAAKKTTKSKTTKAKSTTSASKKTAKKTTKKAAKKTTSKRAKS